MAELTESRTTKEPLHKLGCHSERSEESRIRDPCAALRVTAELVQRFPNGAIRTAIARPAARDCAPGGTADREGYAIGGGVASGAWSGTIGSPGAS